MQQQAKSAEISIKRPPGTPDWVTIELLENTVKTWQPFYNQRLLALDALEIVLNMSKLIDSLEQREEPLCRLGPRIEP